MEWLQGLTESELYKIEELLNDMKLLLSEIRKFNYSKELRDDYIDTCIDTVSHIKKILGLEGE